MTIVLTIALVSSPVQYSSCDLYFHHRWGNPQEECG